jgi:hypothetical protein
MRRAAKADRNQPEIVAAARKMGATVQHLHTIGGGCPDVAVGFRGVNHFWEIKDGEKSASAQKLTPDEAEWHDTWEGQVAIVRSVDDVVRLLNEGGN